MLLQTFFCYDNIIKHLCGHGGMADAADSKSATGDCVWVQVPLPAYLIKADNNKIID